MSDSAQDKDCVVILHGIARTYRCMRSLANFIEDKGYKVFNMGYPSTRFPLDSLIEQVNRRVENLNRNHQRKIHFVGYSMGGLLARGVINWCRPPNLGRVVQLAPPNQGSEVADFWKNNFLFKWMPVVTPPVVIPGPDFFSIDQRAKRRKGFRGKYQNIGHDGPCRYSCHSHIYYLQPASLETNRPLS